MLNFSRGKWKELKEEREEWEEVLEREHKHTSIAFNLLQIMNFAAVVSTIAYMCEVF